MPIQAPQWMEYLNCPVCCREFGPPPRSPISLGCGHTLCEHCLKNLHRKQCPFDQTVIHAEPEELVVNTALLQLAGYSPPAQPYHPPVIKALPEHDRQAYDVIVRCLEHLAIFLKFSATSKAASNRLSRSMQRKLVTLLQCAISDEEGRGRAARSARSLGERSVTELILQHQNPQQLSANLWAAVRARGCQFLGPAMQEEVLKLVLLALEDGSALSRKVLVMFVVQRLEPHFPQASKTSIGHVVQLLYRASCFKVSKRECDSSLMQLKEEFRTYELLRREHDAQIVQIATEAGLRIAPDQWSSLLYGDTSHKSHMQSIIDKLQTPQSFAQSIQELYIALQRTGEPTMLVMMSDHLDRLANIDSGPDARSPTWHQLAEIITSITEVFLGFMHYLKQQASGRDTNQNNNQIYLQEKAIEVSKNVYFDQLSPQSGTQQYKTAMCRDAVANSYCPRGNTCTFAHFEEELERNRALPNSSQPINGNYSFMPMSIQPILPQMYPRFPIPPPHTHLDNFSVPPIQQIATQPMATQPISTQPMAQDLLVAPNTEFGSEHPRTECVQPTNYASAIMHNQQSITMNQNGGIMIPLPEHPFYGTFNMVTIHDEPANNIQFPGPDFVSPVFQGPNNTGPGPGPLSNFQNQDNMVAMPNMFVSIQHDTTRNISPYSFDEPIPSELLPDYRVKAPGFAPVVRDRLIEPSWPPTNNVFNFDSIRSSLPHGPSTTEDIYTGPSDRRAVGADRLAVDRLTAVASDFANRADDELEEELQALERRIDTEFKSTD